MANKVKQDYLPALKEQRTFVEARKSKLTHKQLKFVHEYVSNGHNATKAALAAGYSPKAADQSGTENLANPIIGQKIDDHIGFHLEAADVTFDWKIQILKQMIHKCLTGEGLKDEKPNPSALVSCIAELNKMQGHLAVEKHAHLFADVDMTAVEEMVKNYQKEF